MTDLQTIIAEMRKEPTYSDVHVWADRLEAIVRQQASAAPAVAKVPDALTYADATEGYVHGWNACRAAMLEGKAGHCRGVVRFRAGVRP